MGVPKPSTIGESLYWSYANLGGAHAAVADGSDVYTKLHFMIRSRLYKGLRAGTMKLGSLVDDERLKMVLPQVCCYCGSSERLSVDHLIAKSKCGADLGKNLVWCCRSCNSSKSNTDLLVWYRRRDEFPPLLLLRRYLKMAIHHCVEAGLMGVSLDAVENLNLPFALDHVPHEYPKPSELVLWVVPLGTRTIRRV